MLLSKKTRPSLNLDTPVLKVNDKWISVSCYQRSLAILAQIYLCLPTVKKKCAELNKSGKTTSGVYTIDPDGLGAFKSSVTKRQAVGGWTVFQRRLDGSVDFYRGWTDYKNGFGNLYGEFWLGLDKIQRLTTTVKNKLRVDLMDTNGKTAYAEYNMFAVPSEKNKYKLSVGTYSGNLSDNKEFCCCQNLQYSLTKLETALSTMS